MSGSESKCVSVLHIVLVCLIGWLVGWLVMGFFFFVVWFWGPLYGCVIFILPIPHTATEPNNVKIS